MKKKQFIIGMLIITITSQLYLDILVADFRVTLALVSMGVFLCFYRKVNPIHVGIIIGFTTLILQSVIFFIKNGYIDQVWIGYVPELFFYVTYGCVIKFVVYKMDIRSLDKIFIIAILGDFFSNVIEMMVRIVFLNQSYHSSILPILFLVACIRGMILILILRGIKIYKMLLLKEEHESRYQRLIHMTILLKDEMYWFEKNKIKVESSMEEAYKLFVELKKSNNDELAKKSLNLAGDIHEMSKEYELVLRGFKEITEEKYEIGRMKFSDIIKIFKNTMEYEIKQKKILVDIDYLITNDFYTTYHFEVMSVIRNLIANSLESLDENRKGQIKFKHYKKDDHLYFVVEDNGKGILKENQNDIFDPGFSTKINYETGEVNRGLGLSLVKDLIENKLKGSIETESNKNIGTKFKIIISKDILEE